MKLNRPLQRQHQLQRQGRPHYKVKVNCNGAGGTPFQPAAGRLSGRGGRYRVKSLRRALLFDVAFLFYFGGFEAFAYFGFFPGFYVYFMGFGYQAFGFEDYGVMAGF